MNEATARTGETATGTLSRIRLRDEDGEMHIFGVFSVLPARRRAAATADAETTTARTPLRARAAFTESGDVSSTCRSRPARSAPRSGPRRFPCRRQGRPRRSGWGRSTRAHRRAPRQA